MEKEIYESPVMEEIELEESFSFGYCCFPTCGGPHGHGHRHRP
jgi:hypothetical protein